MKKIFNLAVAMSVIASSLFFASCGEDEDEEESPKQEQNNNDNNNNNDEGQQGNNGTVDEGTTSITAVVGDSYSISNAKLGISGASLSIVDVTGSTVTVTVSGASITIGSANADKSYAIVASNGYVTAASMSDAKATPEKVLFICKSGSVLASGTEAASADINSKAGKTTFVKQ